MENSYSKFRWFVLVIAALSFMSVYNNMVAFASLLGKIAVSLKVNQGTATQLIAPR